MKIFKLKNYYLMLVDDSFDHETITVGNSSSLMDKVRNIHLAEFIFKKRLNELTNYDIELFVTKRNTSEGYRYKDYSLPKFRDDFINHIHETPQESLNSLIGDINVTEYTSVYLLHADFGYAHLGNGLVVYDRLNFDPRTNDYRNIAHIDPDRVIKYYNNFVIPESHKLIVEHIASTSDPNISATQDCKVFRMRPTFV